MSAAPSMVCAGIEIALNRYLRIEPAALADCERLASSLIELHLAGLEWQIFIGFDARGVQVSGESARVADVTVSGPPPAFAQFAIKAAGGESALPPSLSVRGDAELLQRFRRLLGRVGFDIEEWLAPLLGDGAAHRAAQGLKSLLSWGRGTRDTLMQNTAEYLREETMTLARGVDVADWMHEVDRLRERADRFDARLQRLERSRATTTAGTP